MNSEGHRDNILRVVFKIQGIGLSYDNDDDYFGNGYYFTQKLCITEPVTNVNNETETEPLTSVTNENRKPKTNPPTFRRRRRWW